MTIPYLYQLQDARKIRKFRGRCLVASDPGTGKTFTSLLWLERNMDSALPCIVICPASVKWAWQNEAATHIGMSSQVLSGKKPKGDFQLDKNKLIIINYDILSSWLPTLQAMKPQTMILDESHYLITRNSQRTRAVKTLSRGVKNILALSGTPLTNRPAELWPVLNILRPDLFPAFFPYAQNHCAPKKTPWGWDFRGAARLPELHEKLTNNLMIRRKEEDVLSLPPKTRIVLPVDIERKREYQKAESDFLLWLAQKKPSRVNAAAQAEALVKVGYLKRLAGQLKMGQATTWIDDFIKTSDGKIVIFAVHKDIIASLEKRYRGRCVSITGATPAGKRQTNINLFQEDKKIRVFIGNIKAAGTGITLTAANTVCFVELGWTPGEHIQAEKRCHRISTKSRVSCYYLIGKGTIEEKILSVIQTKQGVLSSTLDGGKSADDIDIYTQLIQMMGKQ